MNCSRTPPPDMRETNLDSLWSGRREKFSNSIKRSAFGLQPRSDGTGFADTRNESNSWRSGMAESLFRKILVPIDFSPCSEEAFRVALTLAKTFQAELEEKKAKVREGK